jgi:methylenetetrahydrofolate dehydrogenase (NADP+) / methenyltetrahydrofolate cyclohydrolase
VSERSKISSPDDTHQGIFLFIHGIPALQAADLNVSYKNILRHRLETAMAAQIIDGKAIAAKVRERIGSTVSTLKEQGITPGLAVVLVGDDPASRVYVGMKKKMCVELGMYSADHELPSTTTEADLLTLIGQLNADARVHGILVQLPLPDHIDTDKVLEAISPDKDADGFHPYNVGRLMIGKPTFQPCTPYGVMVMLDEIGYDLKGKEVVVVGRSNIVGKPVALMCLSRHATVTICHSRTKDLPDVVRRADVVIAAVGKAEMVKGDWIKPGAVVIDVGINRVGEKKLVGDVEYAAAAERASAITPVPGGVGPMTIAMLLQNTLESAQRAATR